MWHSKQQWQPKSAVVDMKLNHRHINTVHQLQLASLYCIYYHQFILHRISAIVDILGKYTCCLDCDIPVRICSSHSVKLLFQSHKQLLSAFLIACTALSLVLCCYQQVYDIFNMSCLGVILHMRDRNGMSTLLNGAAAYSQSHVSCICQVVSHCIPCGFRLLVCPSGTW